MHITTDTVPVHQSHDLLPIPLSRHTPSLLQQQFNVFESWGIEDTLMSMVQWGYPEYKQLSHQHVAWVLVGLFVLLMILLWVVPFLWIQLRFKQTKYRLLQSIVCLKCMQCSTHAHAAHQCAHPECARFKKQLNKYV
jgi:hypothetical protein